mmetsp:Transcript_63523/g.73871  ORF Transcript_63523/g.73871 Transcript_63523/m.73871 type:complete len:273 (+) Transcript_63523:18-836(+)
MFLSSRSTLARVSGVAWNPVVTPTVLRGKAEREGRLDHGGLDGDRHHSARVQLNKIMADSEFLDRDSSKRPMKPLVNLPGVPFYSDLPADPITRLFFQQKGEYALYQGSYLEPEAKDDDRLQIERRDRLKASKMARQIITPVYDFCHRIREASEQKKRFVIVPATHETKGCAQVMLDHGIIAGFRDFANDRAFAVELKYFQNEPTITYIAPSSFDGKQEFEWSPKMMRRLLNNHGIHNRISIYICRTADGRVIDHITATREQIGGRGLMMVC